MQIDGPHTEEEAARFCAALERNTTLMEVLRRAATLNLPGWYLAAGALTQSVWNYITHQDPEKGIDDYDLIYCDDSDLSWEAEDFVIQEGMRIFADLPTRVEIRNQARVHLWYPQKFGIPCPRHTSTEGAITSWLSGTALFGVRLLADGDWKVFAPWGFADILNLTVRPNPASGNRTVYEKKAARWQAIWPDLKIIPWPATPSLDAQEEEEEIC
ncbi:fad binding domain protein [Diaporthe amygdali]|uniref:fad binding domain protein n=1 Tax=Phomopsis amygdali TaxID=1214568 RepID=UPI0022FF2603|nr:fad binding domain protein [Diaporthe amygdali]KAJ0125276.1 fad binding domain protein [Diaporthe amygdali]